MRSPLLLFVCLLYACTGSMPPDQLIGWVESPGNGCIQEAEIKEHKLKAVFLPAALMTYKQFQVLGEPYTDSAFAALEEEYGKDRYFKFSIDLSRNSAGAQSYFAEHSDYLNFYLVHDLALVSGSDTIACAMANPERSANFSPVMNVELAFETAGLLDSDKDLVLVYQGELTENKALEFHFKAKDLNQIPHLKR